MKSRIVKLGVVLSISLFFFFELFVYPVQVEAQVSFDLEERVTFFDKELRRFRIGTIKRKLISERNHRPAALLEMDWEYVPEVDRGTERAWVQVLDEDLTKLTSTQCFSGLNICVGDRVLYRNQIVGIVMQSFDVGLFLIQMDRSAGGAKFLWASIGEISPEVKEQCGVKAKAKFRARVGLQPKTYFAHRVFLSGGAEICERPWFGRCLLHTDLVNLTDAQGHCGSFERVE